jgi:hypothetical protein
VTERTTQVLVTPGSACALCGAEGGPGLHIPVAAPDGQVKLPRVCQPCVSAFGSVFLQLLGHAGAQVAGIAVSMNSTGMPT